MPTNKKLERLVKSIPTVTMGVVVNAFYSVAIENTVVLDVAVQDDSGPAELYHSVQMIKTGGLSNSVPPVGSSAILVFIDGNKENPICVGTIDSEITTQFVRDNKRPRKPPMNLTR